MVLLLARPVIHCCSSFHNLLPFGGCVDGVGILLQALRDDLVTHILKSCNHDNQMSIQFRWSLLSEQPWARLGLKFSGNLVKIRLCLVQFSLPFLRLKRIDLVSSQAFWFAVSRYGKKTSPGSGRHEEKRGWVFWGSLHHELVLQHFAIVIADGFVFQPLHGSISKTGREFGTSTERQCEKVELMHLVHQSSNLRRVFIGQKTGMSLGDISADCGCLIQREGECEGAS
jgi:hypothetical protein